MSIKRTTGLIGLALAAGIGGPAIAAEATGNLGVNAIVADTCTLTAGTALSFATVSTATATSETTAGLVTVLCTSSHASVSVDIDGGENLDGSQRRMKSGTNYLPYAIHKDSSHAEAVAVDGTIYDAGITALVPKIIPVYGQVPSGSYNAGSYSDTLLVTLTY